MTVDRWGAARPCTNERPFGVYVHIPFCRMLCTYCDFVKYRGMEAWFDRYTDAVLREAEGWAEQTAGGRAVSLFLGGGTPSTLGLGRLRALRERLSQAFHMATDAEFCLEANPEDVTAEFTNGLAAAGYRRVSVGIQTFDDALLHRLGRLHTGEQAEQAIRSLQAAGIPSVSADLIFGLPGQSLAAWQTTLERALELGLHHLSCYALTIEPSTPLGRQVTGKRVTVPDDDAAADMYDLACARLAAAGYRHYEVSNWARPGHEARHNQGYWRGDDYVGLGAGAVGCIGGRRWRNAAGVDRYCASVGASGFAITEEETLSSAERLTELVLLALRTVEGLDLQRFAQQTGRALLERPGEGLRRALADGFVSVAGARLRVPEQRWGVLHSITAQILADLP